jgi:hypothetical protein
MNALYVMTMFAARINVMKRETAMGELLSITSSFPIGMRALR